MKLTNMSAISLETLLADAESVAIEHDETGKLISPKLPPMTRLREYAEIARKYAIYHADLRCITLEAEVLPRLHKTLSRLKIYYDQQIEEVYDSHDLDGEKRRMLEEDLERKIEEEVENHRLRVNARLFSYALVEVPTATADITLSDGKRSVEIRVQRNLYDGTLERPECFSLWRADHAHRSGSQRAHHLRRLHPPVRHVSGDLLCTVRCGHLPGLRT